MDTSYIIVIIAIVFVGIFVYNLFFTKEARVKKQIQKTRKEIIDDVGDGELVHISGKVVYLGRTIQAPITKRTCVYYQLKIRDNDNSNNSFSSDFYIDEEKAGDVVIFDGMYYAVIDTKLVAAQIYKDNEQYTGTWNGNSPQLIKYFKDRDINHKDWLGFSENITASEGIVEAGEILHVAGKAIWKNPEDFRFKIPGERVLYVQALNENGVYLSDERDL